MAARLFFAVPLDRINQLALIRQQARLSGVLSRPEMAEGEKKPHRPARLVPVANLHLTLAFLGNVTQSQRQALLARWQTLAVPRVTLTLDGLAHWPRARVICLTTQYTPPPLSQLANALRRDAACHGLHASQRGFRPHITLFRDVGPLPAGPLTLTQPITLTINKVALMESVFEPGGVRYQSIKTWE
ncbi:RNA 2',3'-cyclic phosphodiesterase [Ferrimonas gelatinilytica]|uniref:RNA 2',3'-cyclic phosphodiesterase n=1 Tax=Ferrimonas gelatinilytica TaxID=1255257 RepID=A0ABP9S888_9GAMM